MENINNTTLFSSKRLDSSWLSSNETPSFRKSDLKTPVEQLPLMFPRELLFIFSLIFVQCALLHPKFQRSSSARLIRLSLGPLIIGWSLLCPFFLPVRPFEERSILDGFVIVMMIFKSVEFSLAPGPYHMRGLKTVNGVPVWEKDSIAKPSLENPDSGVVDLTLWTMLLFYSYVVNL
jgi:hypothetical protein